MQSNPRPKKSKFNNLEVNEVHSNLSHDVIEITTDKLTIILGKYVDCLENSKQWQVPLSLIVTIALVLSTTDFKLAFGLNPDSWTAIFVICLAISIGWFFKSLWNRSAGMTIEDLIEKVKNPD